MRKIRYYILALFACFCLFSYSQTFFCSKIPYEKLVDNKKYITISYNTVYNVPNYVVYVSQVLLKSDYEKYIKEINDTLISAKIK